MFLRCLISSGTKKKIYAFGVQAKLNLHCMQDGKAVAEAMQTLGMMKGSFKYLSKDS